jgi:hypothetical protein
MCSVPAGIIIGSRVKPDAPYSPLLEQPGFSLAPIHPSAWKVNSRKYACRMLHRSPARGATLPQSRTVQDEPPGGRQGATRGRRFRLAAMDVAFTVSFTLFYAIVSAVTPPRPSCGQAATVRRITQRHLAIRRSLVKPNSSNRVSGPVCR